MAGYTTKNNKVKEKYLGIPQWSSDQDCMFPIQGAYIQPQARVLDPACWNQELVGPNLKKRKEKQVLK